MSAPATGDSVGAVPILAAEHLRKVFNIRRQGRTRDDFVAVDDVSFAISPAGSLAVVGESGSGKTTVARMIVGLEVPTSGRVLVHGSERKYASTSRQVRRQQAREIQMVFQDPYLSLDPRQTVYQSLDEVVRLHTHHDRDERTTRVRELLSQVGLDDRHERLHPGSLSGGQRQRVAIARALATKPQVLILDEAVSALDVSVQGQVLNLLADLRRELGMTYLFVSHDLAVVQHVSDDTIVMHNGRIVESGPTDQILSDPQDEYTQQLLRAVPQPGWKPRRRTQLGRPVSRLLGLPGRSADGSSIAEGEAENLSSIVHPPG